MITSNEQQTLPKIKFPDVPELYREGCYIDARDSQGDWRVGYILSRNDTTKYFKIRFDGWVDQWDEEYKINSMNLRHFRTVVLGHTGQYSNPSIRAYWKYDPQSHAKRLEDLAQLNQYLSQNPPIYLSNPASLQSLPHFVSTPFMFTQYIRGQTFNYVDFLQCISQTNPNRNGNNNHYVTPSDVNEAIKYLNQFLELGRLYMKSIVSNPEVYFAQYMKSAEVLGTKQDFENNLVMDIRPAYVQAYFEIFDGCTNALGGHVRCATFYKLYKPLLVSLINKGADGAVQGSIQDMCVRELIYKPFVERGGVKTLESLLGQILNYITQNKQYLPFIFLRPLSSFCQRILRLEKNEVISSRLLQIVKRNIENITDKDIKDQDKGQITFVIDRLKEINYPEKTQEYLDTLDVQVSYKYFKCPYFDKKLKGLSSLKDTLDNAARAWVQAHYPSATNSISAAGVQSAPINASKYVTPKWFFRWSTVTTPFFSEVFGDSSHVEVLKKGGEILKLFCQTHTITKQVLDLVIECRKDKHEADVKAVDEILSDLVYCLNVELIDYLFSKIASLPIEKWDEQYFDLMASFSENALKIGKNPKSKYGLQMVYEYALLKQDEKSLNCLFQLLNLPCMQSDLKEFWQKCVQNISKNRKSYLHVCLLLKIEKETHMTKPASSAVLQSKASSTPPPSLVDILVNDIVVNYQKVQELETRFTLLKTILYLLDITPNHVERLWIQFKEKDDIPAPASALFMNWLCRNTDDRGQNQSYKVNEVINPDCKTHIFKNILLDSKRNDFINMSLQDANVLLTFFVQINTNSAALSRLKSNVAANLLHPQQTPLLSSFKVKSLETILGYNQLWALFLNNRNQEVIRRIGDTICQLHSNLSQDTPPQMRKVIAKALIDKCIDYISTSLPKQNYRLIRNCLQLIIKFIDKVEGRFELHQTYKPRFTTTYTRDLAVINTTNNATENLKINISMPFGLVRNQISNLFNRPVRGFKLQSKNKKLISRDLDYCAYYQLKIQPPVSFIPIEYEENIAKQEVNKHLDLLFSLLSTQVSNETWQLVSQLPISPDIKSKIEKAETWKELLTGGLYRQLYILRVISSISDNQLKIFLADHGVDALLSQLQTIQLNTLIEKNYLKTLTDLILKGEPPSKLSKTVPQSIFEVLVKLAASVNKRVTQKLASSKSIGETDASQKQTLLLETEICNNVFEIIKWLKALDIDWAKIADSSKELEFLLQVGLIQPIENPAYKTAFSNQFLSFLLHASHNQASHQHIISILTTILDSMLQQAVKKPNSCLTYFLFSAALIDRLSFSIMGELLSKHSTLSKQLIKSVVHMLNVYPGEQSPRDHRQLTLGLLCFLRSLLVRPELHENNTVDPIYLLNFMLKTCLINTENFEQGSKCKHYNSRLKAFKIVSTLIQKREPKLVDTMVEYLSSFHKKGQWRTRRTTDWNITKMLEKSTTGYVGLRNLGCICYMNSFLQQIFMIPSFRESILQTDDPLFERVKIQDNLLYQLRTLFLALERSDQQFYNPKQFCHAFKDYEGKPTNVAQQMDIDEFSGLLLDRIENQMKGTKAENVIKDHFGGILSNEIICKGCPHFSESKEMFLSIPLQVKNKKDIYQSFETMVKGERLEGDNAYQCDRCNKKVSAVKRVCLKKLPNHLILVLKRFEFNYDTMTKIKINDYCEFPTNLDLQAYSQQALADSKLNEESIIYPPDYFKYELKGVVIHTGHSDSGHYYSFIQNRSTSGPTTSWFEFNDTIVRKFDPENLANQAFGGEEKMLDATSRQKIKNAYLLFYERVQHFDQNATPIPKPETSLSPTRTIPYCDNFLSQLKNENETVAINRLLFAKQYEQFVKDVIDMHPMEGKAPSDLNLNKFSFLFVLTRTIREKEKHHAVEFLQKLCYKAKESPEFSRWIVELFSQQSVVTEMFKSNPSKEVRKLLAGFLAEIVKGLGPLASKKQKADNPHREAVILFVNILIKNINQKPLAATNQLCSLLYKLCKNDQIITHYLIERRVISIIFENMLDKDPTTRLSNKVQPPLNILPDTIPIGKLVEIDQKDVIQELILMRKSKADSEKGYIWALVHQLLSNSDLRKKGNYTAYFGKESLKIQIPREELNMILVSVSTEHIYKWLTEATSKFAIRKLVAWLTLLTIEDMRFSDDLVKVIATGLEKQSGIKFRPFFILFKQLLAIPDPMQEKRLTEYVKQYKLALDKNRKWFVEVDSIIQWFVKTVKKNKKLRDYLRLYDASVRTALTIIKQNDLKLLTEQAIKQNKIPSEKSTYALHGLHIPKNLAGYQELYKIKEKELQTILTTEPLPADPWDSDDDLADKEVVSGQPVSIFVQKGILNFVDATVIKQIFGCVTVEYKNELIQIWKDDEQLSTRHKVVNLDECKTESICNSEETASIASDQAI